MKSTTTALAAATLAVAFSTAADAKTLVFCSDGDPEGFDPALYTTGTTLDASSRQIYDRLVDYRRGTTAVQPALARRWEVSEDGRSYTFHLREGVRFHASAAFVPSRDLNADDVIFSFQRQHDPEHPWHAYAGEIGWAYFVGMSMPDLIEDIVRVDDMTVRFELTRADSSFLATLAMDFASILSEEYAEAVSAAETPGMLDTAPVGTGPFWLDSYAPGDLVRYRAFGAYWRDRAAIDELVFDITPDAAVRAEMLKAGDCQVTLDPNPADLAALADDPEIELMQLPTLDVGYLAYNTQAAPFDNAKVRKALNMAVDRAAIVEEIYGDAGRVATSPLPPTVWSHEDVLTAMPYDPEAAGAMLAEEGVENLSMKIWAMPRARRYNPDPMRMAELIGEDLEAVGVAVEIVTMEWGEYLAQSRDVERDGAVLFGWSGDNGDPDNFLTVGLGCDAVGLSNRAQWCDETFDSLILLAKSEPARRARIDLYRQAQEIVADQAPWLVIANPVISQPVRSEVQGWTVDAFGRNIFHGVDITE